MQIEINQVPRIKTFTLEVESYYTGLTIKKKIEYLYDFSCDGYVLAYELIRIKDDCVLSNFVIEDGGNMNLVEPQYATSESFLIRYKTLTRETGLFGASIGYDFCDDILYKNWSISTPVVSVTLVIKPHQHILQKMTFDEPVFIL
ncbi:hypothetical protein BDF21DRAFT_397223 [Thamnidium elegans]|nr:hypothetical protein BDF21DRAFT_397223 [Thamnidium elegans]